jgi:hypothetical protein
MLKDEIMRLAADSVMAMIMTGAIGKDPTLRSNISRLMNRLGNIAPIARGPGEIDIGSRRTQAKMMGLDRAGLPPVCDDPGEYYKSFRFGNRSTEIE